MPRRRPKGAAAQQIFFTCTSFLFFTPLLSLSHNIRKSLQCGNAWKEYARTIFNSENSHALPCFVKIKMWYQTKSSPLLECRYLQSTEMKPRSIAFQSFFLHCQFLWLVSVYPAVCVSKSKLSNWTEKLFRPSMHILSYLKEKKWRKTNKEESNLKKLWTSVELGEKAKVLNASCTWRFASRCCLMFAG